MNEDRTTGYVPERLSALADAEYAAFSAKLIPDIDTDRVLGVRFPALRELEKELYQKEKAEGSAVRAEFMRSLPHYYHEENLLHALMINRERGFEECLSMIEAFLPCVENWAVCDTLRPKALAREPERFYALILGWLSSPRVYTVRFGFGMLMAYFLNDHFTPEVNALAAEAANAHEGEDYYIDMMAAWYFATALAKQYDATIPYLERGRLPETVRKMTIRKAKESYRVTEEHKRALDEMK